MQIIGIIIWIVAATYTLAWGLLIRGKAKNEQAVEHSFEVPALLFMVSVILIPTLSLSPFHLLWMMPLSYVLGIASLMFPFNLLWFPASLYAALWYIGTRDDARRCYLEGDYAKAIELYEHEAESKPGSAAAYFGLGLACERAGNKKRALARLLPF